MGRELRRKQAKKEGKSLEKEEIIEEKQVKKLITNVLVIVVIMSLIYILSSLFITKELDWFSKGKTEEVGQTTTNNILASELFKQSEEEYYVYFYDFNEKDNIITGIVSSSLVNSNVYKVDTGSAMNANYVSDTSGNKRAQKLDDLKVSAPTLIKIYQGVITEYYEGNEIMDKLG